MPEWLLKIFESDKVWGALIGGGAALIVARWSFKNAVHTEWFKGTVRESIEPRLISFQGEVNRDLERLRNDLNTARMIQEVRLHKVYEKASEGICELLEAMGDLNAASQSLFASYHIGEINKTKLEQIPVFVAAFDKVNLVIFQKRCLIPTTVHKAAEQHLNVLRDMALKTKVLVGINATPDEFLNQWKSNQTDFEKNISTDYERFCVVVKKTFAVDEYFDVATKSLSVKK